MPCGSSKDGCNQDRNAANGHCAFEDLDHSALQQPLNLGVTNIKQILKCVQSGSKEIKDIILNECNVIYECKVCVGLFRSLANFMYHKRCYCKKHMCEDMLLFEKFEEEETIIVQPEAPKEKPEDTIEESAMDLDKSDVAQEMTSVAAKDIKSVPETPCSSKDKNAAPSNKGKAKEAPEFKKPESMMSRRTRDKKDQKPVSSSAASRISVKIKAPGEPPLKCAKMVKIVSEKTETEKSNVLESNEPDKLDSCTNPGESASEQPEEVPSKDSVEKTSSDDKTSDKQDTPSKEIKTKKIEFSKISGMLEKSMPSFPKIIFKTIDSNQNAVFQSDNKKKLETFGLAKKFETATVETKVDNDKLIIVLKKDVNKGEGSSDSKTSDSYKQKSDAEKTSDFHLTRRKRLMARTDCDVHELKCLVCKTQFMSLKTLYFHMLSLHSKKRLYYPCPFCKTLFVQMYGVTRHLVAIHNKTKDQINKLRDVIKKKSVWKKVDDANPVCDKISPLNYQIKEPSPPPQPLEIKAESPKEPERESCDSPDSLKAVIKLGKHTTLHQCSKCNRVFGRKSSQVSHEKFCIMNAPVKQEGSDTPPPPAQPSPPIISTPPSNQSVMSFLSFSPAKSPVSSKPILQFRPVTTPIRSTPLVQKQSSDTKISIRPKRGAEKQMHKDFVNSQTLKWRSANRIETSANKPPPNTNKPPPPKKNPKDSKSLEKKVLNFMNPDDLTCLKCDKKFSSYSNLRRHVAIHVGWTRFKCKFCDYQAYNKSQCWAHVQKAHSVEEDEMDKSIVNLVNTNTSNKKSTKGSHASSSKQNLESSVKTSPKTAPIPKVKISKKKVMNVPKISDKKRLQIQKIMNDAKVSEKKQLQVHKVLSDLKKAEKKQLQQMQKKITSNVKKVEIKKDTEEEVIESKKEKSQPLLPFQKMPKDTSEAKKERTQATIMFPKLPRKEAEKEVKKEKPHHIIPIQKLTISKDTNYKSVTTSNPTTIILSKKIPSSTVQSIITIPSSESASSASKISPIRTSPRKAEIKGPGGKLITTLVTRSNANTKTTPIQIKLPPKSNSVEELSKETPEKNCSKKERLISEWFPKKDLSSSNIRRESAPLIIGLVPAGLNARAKSSGAPPEKPASSP